MTHVDISAQSTSIYLSIYLSNYQTLNKFLLYLYFCLICLLACTYLYPNIYSSSYPLTSQQGVLTKARIDMT